MDSDQELIEHVLDLLGNNKKYTTRKMFGGYGLYVDNVMFGLICEGSLYFKVDDENKERFLSEGLNPFEYNRNGKVVKMSYYEVPENALENSDVMADWAESSIAAAKRNLVKKMTKKRKTRK